MAVAYGEKHRSTGENWKSRNDPNRHGQFIWEKHVCSIGIKVIFSTNHARSNGFIIYKYMNHKPNLIYTQKSLKIYYKP